MKKMMAGWITVVALLASAGSLAAHHSLSQFDTTTAVRVKGAIVRFELINPHSLLFVDQKREDGLDSTVGRGRAIASFNSIRMGIDKDALKVGDVIEVCGYVLKDDVITQRTVITEPISLSLKAATPKSVSGRPLTGEVLVTPDGQKRAWLDYGHHKCFGPDYQDRHSK